MGGILTRSLNSLGDILHPFLFEGWLLNPPSEALSNMNRRIKLQIMMRIVGHGRTVDFENVFRFDLDERSFRLFTDLGCFMPGTTIEQFGEQYFLYVSDTAGIPKMKEACCFLFFAQMYYRYNMVIQHQLILALATATAEWDTSIHRMNNSVLSALETCNLQVLDQFLEALEHPQYDPDILKSSSKVDDDLWNLMLKMYMDASWFAKQEEIYFPNWKGYTFFETDAEWTQNGFNHLLHSDMVALCGYKCVKKSDKNLSRYVFLPHIRWVDYFLTHVIEPADAYLANARFTEYQGVGTQVRHGWNLEYCKRFDI